MSSSPGFSSITVEVTRRPLPLPMRLERLWGRRGRTLNGRRALPALGASRLGLPRRRARPIA